MANYWPALDQVSIECQPSIDKDVTRIPIKVSIKGINRGYQHLAVDALGTHDLAAELNSYLIPLYTFPLVEDRWHCTLKLIGNLVALYMHETIKYARTLISMVFFCNWCSAADSSFFSSSTISSSLFFDSLCSCDNNECDDSLFWLHR